MARTTTAKTTMARPDPLARRVAMASVALVAAFAIACTRRPPPEERVDGWPLARAALTSGEHCFARRSEYCITDEAFVDGAIRPHLDDLYGGVMPERRALVEATIRDAALRYRKRMLEPDVAAKVEALVRRRYAEPVVRVEPELVTVDVGVVPGPLAPNPATSSLRLMSSPLAPEGDLDRAALVRLLGIGIERVPSAAVVRVLAMVPSGHALVARSYRWLARESRLVVGTGSELRTTGRLPSPAALLDSSTPYGFRVLPPCRPELYGPIAPSAEPPSLEICPVEPVTSAASAIAQPSGLGASSAAPELARSATVK